MTIPEIARGACRWISASEHLVMTKSSRLRDLVTCCGCGTKVEYQFAYVTKAFGRNGIGLPLPVFIHCGGCRLAKDATEAWYKAWRSVPPGTPRTAEVDEEGHAHIISPT